MLITINTDKLQEFHLTMGEVLLALAQQYNVNLADTAERLLRVQEADPSLAGNFDIEIRPLVFTRLESLMAASYTVQMSDEELEALATELKAIYPKGKKDGKWYWADGVQLIVKRLRLFFRKFGEFRAEEIIDATRRYVQDYQGRPDMRLLKYFLFKSEAVDGMIEPSSDLLNYIENKDEASGGPDDFLVLR